MSRHITVGAPRITRISLPRISMYVSQLEAQR